MEREVFIHPTGESAVAWDLHFGAPHQHVETRPAADHSQGVPSRTGKAHVTIESMEVRFDVTINAIETAGVHILVIGLASRTVDISFEWDR
jgi:hypothetical protein